MRNTMHKGVYNVRNTMHKGVYNVRNTMHKGVYNVRNKMHKGVYNVRNTMHKEGYNMRNTMHKGADRGLQSRQSRQYFFNQSLNKIPFKDLNIHISRKTLHHRANIVIKKSAEQPH